MNAFASSVVAAIAALCVCQKVTKYRKKKCPTCLSCFRAPEAWDEPSEPKGGKLRQSIVIEPQTPRFSRTFEI